MALHYVNAHTDLLRIVRAALPGYRKHQIAVHATSEVTWRHQHSYSRHNAASHAYLGGIDTANSGFPNFFATGKNPLSVGEYVIEVGPRYGSAPLAHILVHPESDLAKKFCQDGSY